MKNFVRKGDNLPIAAPYTITAGQGVQVGSALFGVAVSDITSASTGLINMAGVYSLAKTTGLAFAAGARAWWDNTARALTNVSTGNISVGVVTQAASSSSTAAQLRLGAVPPSAT